jgi:hypothetical protein
MNTPEFMPRDLPPSPWILVDRTTIEQTATVLGLLEEWLTGGDPHATRACAQACSAGQDDAAGVARWVGTLADRLADRLKEVDSWS